MISIGSPRSAMACAAAMRCPPLNASRLASAAARRSFFDWSVGEADMRRYILTSSPAKAGDPVFQSAGDGIEKLQRTGYPAFAGYDESASWACGGKQKSAKPRWPLEHSIPEFPTKVGGHHVTGSTDPARDSSRKDR